MTKTIFLLLLSPFVAVFFAWDVFDSLKKRRTSSITLIPEYRRDFEPTNYWIMLSMRAGFVVVAIYYPLNWPWLHFG